MKEISGILIVDKAKGMTSHDVVHFVRKNFSIKKVGHAGTLDPSATGVLVLLLGKCTKLSATFLNEEKEYTATMKLGERTDSGDSEGEVIAKKEVNVDGKEIKRVIELFVGEIEQIPPMVSAKKINGQRLYKLARKGLEIERKPSKIRIKEIEITKINIPFVDIRVVCSKGTYIRQLVDDVGEDLGCGAHLVDLRRTRSGKFSLSDSVPFLRLGKMREKDLNESIVRI
ncbi:MAG: tRNA pseudouridine(55) synthase TruB [Candidatus Omnitrophota bacterium]